MSIIPSLTRLWVSKESDCIADQLVPIWRSHNYCGRRSGRGMSAGRRPCIVGRCRNRDALRASGRTTLFRGEPKLLYSLPISPSGMLRTQLASSRAVARRLYSSRGRFLKSVLGNSVAKAPKQLHSHCLSVPGQRHGVPPTLLTPRSSRNMASTLVSVSDYCICLWLICTPSCSQRVR